MEGNKIIEAITNLFKGTDERDWELVKSVMAKNVLLDYTSMAGGEPGILTPAEIVDLWASFLPGFDTTHHQLSEFRVRLHGIEADVDYVGKADHFIGNEVWTISGTYQTKLEKQNGTWLITYLKLNYDRQSGNTSLPKQAKARLGKLQS
ncbi:nuclear transport factor 2 family protein [Mucilaginibacter pocheonensis]|uniref:SnoaL-like domain-containing protein n=1 Tax=Mucilaginibacter pocheonensis TaxID=398050 RepID=A0ABU1TB98_9SPHI|nr:nuclear transport factor 2 family protein [Mucilaginibacter pocheonensis]MDR6942521.1 hypothetical protein [Mucilaginibacter pocheonensis]